MMKEGKKYPCEQCPEGTYMTVEQEWWCDEYLMYTCSVEKHPCFCEKFKTTNGDNVESLAIERYQDLVDYFDDKDQKPCEDCVSRQAVLDMASVIETDDYSGNENLEVVDVDDIKALPSVTPAPKKGKWIDTDVTLLNRQGDLVHEVICSECNGISYFRKMGNKYIGANYCPNCGAKLEVEE